MERADPRSSSARGQDSVPAGDEPLAIGLAMDRWGNRYPFHTNVTMKTIWFDVALFAANYHPSNYNQLHAITKT